MDVAIPPLSIRLLGTPEIALSGSPLVLKHLKARALLFYLAATGESHTRPHLATLLWSESGEREAYHSLRSSLYRLRQALRRSQAEDILGVEGERLALHPDTCECDVIEFRRLLAGEDEAALARAVALYRGPLLQGFSLPGAPVFDEWVRLEDTRLSQACYAALERLADGAESRQAWAPAVGYARQMLQIDRLSEAAQARLMRLYLRQGEPGLAVRQYRRFEELLRSETSLAPSSETQALLHEALRQSRKPLTTLPARLASRQQGMLPFVGRDALIQQLSAICREVQGGHGRTVLLQGEAGIGKSRLLDEMASRLMAGSPPWTVLYGACSPFDDLLSHGPFLQALQDGLSGEDSYSEGLDDLRLAGPDAVLPGGRAGFPTLALSDTHARAGDPDVRGQFSWGVLQVIRALAQSGPLLFVIDDLQWANSATLNLFGLLSMRIPRLPALLVGTVQHAEAIPALKRLVTLGRRRGELHLLALTPISREAVSALLHASGLYPPSVATLSDWLHSKSGGSPFLLTEIMAQLRAETILQPAGAGWQLDTPHWLRWLATFTLPETAHDLVAWRLSDLTPEARRLLDVLAVAGQPLPVPVLRSFPGIPADALLALVDTLSDRGLVIEPPGASLALPHHLIREALLHRMSNLRRRSIDRHLAEVLEAQAALEAASLRQIALHAVAGEDVERSRRYGLPLLPDLPQEYTGAETVDFVQHLYDLLAPAATAEEMVQITRALGTLHQSLGHLDVAAHWHQETRDWAQKAGNIPAQCEAYLEMSELALVRNDYNAAAGAAQAGLSILPGLLPAPSAQPLMGRAHRLLGAALAMEGSDLTTAEDQLQQAVAAYRRSGVQGDLCAALFELGNIAAQRGDLPRALELYDESALAAQAGRIHYYLALARNNFAYHSLLLCRIEAAQASAVEGVKVAEAYDLLAALLHLYSTQGEIHLYLSEWDAAEASFQRGLSLAEDLGSLERQAGYRGGLALAARGRKDLGSALRLLEEALALIAGSGYWHLHTRLQLCQAEVLIETARFTEAERLLDASLAVARRHQRALLLVQGECLRARLFAACGDWPSADALFAETLENASALGLSLEIGRVQAAWGKAALHVSPVPGRAHTLIAAARSTFLAHNARADLAQLP